MRADGAVGRHQQLALSGAAQQDQALAAEEGLAAAPLRVDVDGRVGGDPRPGLDQQRAASRRASPRSCRPAGRRPPPTIPPVAELKSLTKKLSPPSERLSPFMKPPCVRCGHLHVAAGHGHGARLDAHGSTGGG